MDGLGENSELACILAPVRLAGDGHGEICLALGGKKFYLTATPQLTSADAVAASRVLVYPVCVLQNGLR